MLALDKETGILLLDGKPAEIKIDPTTKERVAFDGRQWVPIGGSTKTLGDLDQDLGRSVARGATLGLAPHAAAAAGAVAPWLRGQGGFTENYEKNLATERKRDEGIPSGLRLGGELAGAMLTPQLVPGKLAALAARAPAGLRDPVIGGAAGAIFGAAEAKPGERSEGAWQGGLWGTGLGAVVPPVVRGASALMAPQIRAGFELHRGFAQDRMTPEQAIAKFHEIRQLRPEATLADVAALYGGKPTTDPSRPFGMTGGQNVPGLVERLAQTPGGARTDVIGVMEERQRGQRNRLAADLKGLTGTAKGAFDATADTIAQRKALADPLYQDAFNFDATKVPAIVQAWQRETSTGYGKAALANEDFTKLLQTKYLVDDPRQAPLMTQIQAWKEVADDMITKAYREGSAVRGNALKDMRDRVVSVVDQHNPKYQQARGVWENESSYLDAIEKGRDVLKRGVDPQQFAADVAKMTDYQREAHRIGAVSEIVSRMGGDPAKLADLTKYVRSENVKQNLAALMPTPQAQQEWAKRLAYEMRSSEQVGQAIRGSPTARRLAEQKQVEGLLPDLVIDMIQGAPATSILRRMVGGTTGKVGDTVRTRSDEALAKLLTDPAVKPDEIARVMQRGGRSAQNAALLPVQTSATALPFLLGGEQ